MSVRRVRIHRTGYSPAAIPGFAVGTFGQRNDTIVLRKGCHGRDGAKGGEDTVAAVCKHTTLNTALVDRALDLQSGHIACCGDITDRLACANDKDGHEWQYERTIHRKWEGLDPDEGANGCLCIKISPGRISTSGA